MSDYYLVDGELYPRVTTVLKWAGIVNFDRVPPHMLERARMRGSLVHDAIEKLSKDEPYLLPAEYEPYIDAYNRFLDETKFVLHASEEAVVCRSHRYAGTMDLAGVLNERPSVIDTKCSYAMPKSTALQTAAYRKPLVDNGWPADTARYGLHLKPDGDYKLYPFEDEGDEAVFLAAVRVAHWQTQHGERRAA